MDGARGLKNLTFLRGGSLRRNIATVSMTTSRWPTTILRLRDLK
jgi:hypothetical protein